MTDLKQAAQMALEALRYPLDTSAKLFDADKAELMSLRAINALRKALEEQPEKYTFGTPLLDLFKVSPGQIVHADAVADPQTTHWEGCEAVHPECRKPDTDCHAQGICQRSGYSIAPTPRITELEAELSEQARVNGMGGEREARLMTELERKSDAIQRLWKERDELRALNAELVEALRGWMNQPEDAATYDACMARAEAALAKVEANNGS